MSDRPQYKHKWYLQNRERLNLKHKKYWNRIRNKVIKAYGGKCTLCGSKENLTIDHINGNGGIERKTTTYAKTIYFFLIRNNFPKENYRLLCMSCNLIEYWKRRNTLDK